MDFEWDADKAEENQRKHQVGFAEAAETFSDPRGFVLRDEKHSHGEERFYWVGKSDLDRILTTRFTRSNIIRIIGSGEWREYRKIYNEKTKLEKS